MNGKHDILLINPPYWSVYTPFLAIPCLSAVLKKNGFTVEKSDLNIIHFNNLLHENALRQSAFMMSESYFNNLFEQGKESFICSTYEEYKSKSAFLRTPNFTTSTIKKMICNLDKGQLGILDMFLARIYKTNVYMPKEITRQSILDEFEQLDTEGLLKTLYTSGILTANMPNVIGFSATTEPQLVVSLYYANIIKTMYPDVKIILGGSYTNLLINSKTNEELAALFSFVDFLSFNEGETFIVKMMDRLVRGAGDLPDIPNLIYNNNGVVCRTEIRAIAYETERTLSK